MTKYLNYDESFSLISQSSELNIEIMSNLIKNLTLFSDEILRIHKDLLKIYENISKTEKKVPTKKHLFKKAKISNEIDAPEEQFQKIILKLLTRLITPPMQMELQNKLKTEFIAKLSDINEEYNNTFQEIKNINEFSNLILRKSQESFSKVYDDYNKLCEQLESAHSHLSSGENDALRSQYETLKQQFTEKQKQLFELLKEYNNSNGKYFLAMEENLTKWENSDKKKNEAIMNLLFSFSNVLMDISAGTKDIAESLTDIFENYDFDTDHQEYNYPALSLTQDKRKIVEFNMPPLPFEITEYVNPELAFQEELKEYTDIASEEYKGDICFSVNDQLIVHSTSEDQTTCIVSKPATNEIAQIPTSVLYHSRQNEGKLMKVISPYSDGKINLREDEIVCASGIGHSRTICTTLSGQKVEVPVSILTNI